MLELLTGTGLAVASGLNAYIPLLLLGLTARFTDLVALPASWAWLENPWVLVILGALLVVEFFADKIPGVDTVNDVVQTIVRPTAGGLAFGSGSAASTAAVTDPAAFFSSDQWIPVAIGVLLALAVHLAKMLARPVINAASAGLAAPVASVIEDVGSVALAVLALVIPVLAVLVIIAAAVGAVLLLRKLRRRNRRSRAPARATTPAQGTTAVIAQPPSTP
jgi:hypothetical protein